MPRKKDKPAVKERGHSMFETMTGREDRLPEEAPPGKGDSATVADEASAPEADPDLPVDGQVRNDAVLRGEDHADE